jgi:hypothetical protein
VAPPNVSLGPENTHNNDDVERQSVHIQPDHNTLQKKAADAEPRNVICESYNVRF